MKTDCVTSSVPTIAVGTISDDIAVHGSAASNIVRRFGGASRETETANARNRSVGWRSVGANGDATVRARADVNGTHAIRTAYVKIAVHTEQRAIDYMKDWIAGVSS